MLISTLGPENTFITSNFNNTDEQSWDSVITMNNITQNNAVLDGFTLQNGYGKGVDFEYFVSIASDSDLFNNAMYNDIKSGGISAINSSITLSNLIIKNNISENFGSGIGLVDSQTQMMNVLIEQNSIPEGNALGGGGIAINGGYNATIDTWRI